MEDNDQVTQNYIKMDKNMFQDTLYQDEQDAKNQLLELMKSPKYEKFLNDR